MNIISERNLSKVTIYAFIIIMFSLVMMISYFYVINTNKDFETQMKKFRQEYYEAQRNILKKQVHTIIDIIEYDLTKKNIKENELKKDIINLLNSMSLKDKETSYYFVYKLLDIKGGDNFAKLIVNPNRKDLIGQTISTNFKDIEGKKFRKLFLDDIRKKGESFTQYLYLKPHTKNKVKKKLAYFKYFKKWNWIISIGIYTDTIEKDILKKRKNLELRVKNQVGQNIVLFIMFLFISILISILISKKIDEALLKYQRKVKAKTKELEELNQNLEKRVEDEIEKNREKEQLLVQKSKFIALGEMISNIAHQWRQPLSELSSILMFIKFKHSINNLDSELMDKKMNEADKVLEFMSHTIDDFRNFFMPKKEKEEFYICDMIDSVMLIVSSSLKNNNIKVNINIDKDIKLKTYLNEYQQVVLNILNNAKDVLIERQIKNPMIKINAYEELDYVALFIEDNAGGITIEPLAKVFEPYFTTKSDGDGTGIGLYMSKIIVDKNMKGKLRVRNTKKGANFGIWIPKFN